MVEINWLEEARNDLKEIFDFISQSSHSYANRELTNILRRVQVIHHQVRAGKMVPEINRADIREITSGNYRIIYRICNETSVDILMIHHGARDLKKRIP